jgi:arylsulfatase A-like enzyme
MAKAEPFARPNIVLVMADDMGWGAVSYNRHPVLRRPDFAARPSTCNRDEPAGAISGMIPPTMSYPP